MVKVVFWCVLNHSAVIRLCRDLTKGAKTSWKSLSSELDKSLVDLGIRVCGVWPGQLRPLCISAAAFPLDVLQ